MFSLRTLETQTLTWRKQTDVTFQNVSVLQLESTDLAYQLGTGMNWAVADGVKAGVGYRYFAGPEVNAFGTTVSDGTNNSVIAQVSFSLN
jgi:opacity protein-like surface antigen